MRSYGAQLVPPNFYYQVSFSRRQFSLARLFVFGTTFFPHDQVGDSCMGTYIVPTLSIFVIPSDSTWLIPCNSVARLPCYSVSLLLCYFIALLPCYRFSSLLCYLKVSRNVCRRNTSHLSELKRTCHCDAYGGSVSTRFW